MHYQILINWGLSNVACDNSRHSAECTNADDLFGAYILSCHLIIHVKKTISMSTVDHRVLELRAYPYNSCTPPMKLTGSL